jgi:exodeoxyribonuclease VII large subunit
VPDRTVLRSRIAQLARQAQRIAQRLLEIRMQRLDGAARRLVHPAARIARQRERLASLALRLTRAAGAAQTQRRRELARSAQSLARVLRAPPAQRAALARTYERWRRGGAERVAALDQRVAALASGLRHLSPQEVLERGYSIVTTEAGAVVQDAAQVAAGDDIALRFARGTAAARVTRARSD